MIPTNFFSRPHSIVAINWWRWIYPQRRKRLCFFFSLCAPIRKKTFGFSLKKSQTLIKAAIEYLYIMMRQCSFFSSSSFKALCFLAYVCRIFRSDWRGRKINFYFKHVPFAQTIVHNHWRTRALILICNKIWIRMPYWEHRRGESRMKTKKKQIEIDRTMRNNNRKKLIRLSSMH